MLPQSLSPRASASVDEEKQSGGHEVHEQNTAFEGIEPSPDLSSDTEKGADGEVKPAAAAEDKHEYITGIKLFLVIAGVTLACFLMLLDTSIITTVCPYSVIIERLLFAYRPTRPSLELPVTSTLFQMWAGMAVHTFLQSTDIPSQVSHYVQYTDKLQLRNPASDGKGLQQFQLQGKGSPNSPARITPNCRQVTFLFFLGTFELGSVLCGAAISSIMLILGRTVAGIGASGLVNGALTIISAVVPMHKRPAMMGIMMGCGQMGLVAGPLIGGAFTQYVSWRWCFYINLPIGGLAAIFLLLINIPDRVDRSADRPPLGQILGQLDIFGFILFAPFAVMLLLALQWGGIKYAWNSATIIGLFCGSAGMFLVFGAWEYRVGEGAMIPFYMVRQRIIYSSCLVMGCFFGSLLCITFYLPIYFQAVKGVTPGLSGVYLLPSILSMMIMAVTSGIFGENERIFWLLDPLLTTAQLES
jgi:MFS family permease